jgi:spermidine/putrescine-binding protein
LLEKMESGVAAYDVIVPSDYMVSILKRQNLLKKLDLNQIPNFRNISARFKNPSYDPDQAHSVPFLWSTCGIGYNKTKIQEKVDSWEILWNPKYANHILMLDDPRESFGATLKWRGHSFNATDPRALLQARDLLLQQKPLLKAYNSTSFDELLLSGDVWLAHGWSGNIAMVMAQDSNLDYVIPKEGASVSVEISVFPMPLRIFWKLMNLLISCSMRKSGRRPQIFPIIRIPMKLPIPTSSPKFCGIARFIPIRRV